MEQAGKISNALSANDFLATLVRLGNKRLEKIEKEFKLDDENIKQYTQIAEYFLGIPNGLNPNKGLCVLGNVGSGKSIVFELTKEMMFFGNAPTQLKDKSFKIEICEEIATLAKKEGESILYNFKKGVYLFDDLGDEEIKKNYGDVVNSMYIVIKQRYRSFWDYNLVTHFTSNLDRDSFINMYGERSYSRIKEMCNIIELKSKKDRRLT